MSGLLSWNYKTPPPNPPPDPEAWESTVTEYHGTIDLRLFEQSAGLWKKHDVPPGNSGTYTETTTIRDLGNSPCRRQTVRTVTGFPDENGTFIILANSATLQAIQQPGQPPHVALSVPFTVDVWTQVTLFGAACATPGEPVETVETRFAQVNCGNLVTGDLFSDQPISLDFGCTGPGQDVTGVLTTDPPAPNIPPNVSAGTPLTGRPGALLQLSGSGSDRDAGPISPLTFLWSVDSAPDQAVVTFGNNALARTTVRFSKPGLYVIRLTAFDGADSTAATTTARIDCVTDCFTKPIAAFTHTVKASGEVTFDAGTSHSTTTGGVVTAYEWAFGDDAKATQALPTATHTYAKPDKVDATLTVVDSTGTRSDPVTKSVDRCSPDSPATDMSAYTKLLECVPVKIQADGRASDPRTVLSLVRQLYYGTDAWSTQSRNALWANVIPCGIGMSDPTQALGQKLKDAFKMSVDIEGIDVGHVLTALEASECPSNSVTMPPGTTPAQIPLPNWIWATWGGDVGSAAGQKAYEERHPPVGHPAVTWPQLFGSGGLAGPTDLRGDMDGLAMQHRLTQATCAAPPKPFGWTTTSLATEWQTYFVDSVGQSNFGCFKQLVAGSAGVALRPLRLADVPLRTRNGVTLFAVGWYRKLLLDAGTSRLATLLEIAANTGRITQRTDTANQLFVDWVNAQ